MPEYRIDKIEAERILQLSKWIETDPVWLQDNGHWSFRLPVWSVEQQPLEWYARYNPRNGIYTSILFWHHVNLRRLDVGKIHHNPDCHDIGRMHKHRLTDANHNRDAYEPLEVLVSDDVVTVLGKFLGECQIELRSTLQQPPASYRRDLG